ncbi:TadE/TadG family type IV pilus assembly protein [Streptomyces sp. SL13]|uniref:TadE/TadG family type IV pilus assembly protein n=1 Tax=Streptantibioticus silvisoli TaxID=2705255 RepID=A0AA90HCU8_9ACTN|nr:TadE/TadG family type IV pilus assembly protein [Streptantibioticus silvisoli]MDI5974027.1 TadE/TadG family type IV pilus assembly protein [Streptantibioticus silvisoli]
MSIREAEAAGCGKGGFHRRSTTLWKTDGGSAATELVLVTPLLVLLLLVAVAFGRGVSARLRVNDAAHQAARAATLSRTAAQAQRQARTAALASLGASGASCARLAVTTAVGMFAPGGVVRVSVACTADLGVSGLPAHVVITRTAVSVVDLYRGTA